MYGFQGTQVAHFLEVSILTSLAWVAAYMVLGRVFRTRILQVLHILDSRGRATAVLEAAITVLTLVLVIRPF
jgi:membrane protein DedA with SNARE-associated domain